MRPRGHGQPLIKAQSSASSNTLYDHRNFHLMSKSLLQYDRDEMTGTVKKENYKMQDLKTGNRF